MQTVSSAFSTAAAAAVNQPTFSSIIAWLKQYNSTATFFTINTSKIGGTDFIYSGGGIVTLFDRYSYLDETPRVNRLSIDRTMSSIPIGIMSAQLDVEYDNTSKRYLPSYDATIGQYIKPGRPIKVAVGFSGENVQQFVGYTGRPSLTLGNRTMKLHAFDAMEYINNFESSLAMQQNITVTDMLKLLLQEVGFTTAQYSIEASVQPAIKFIAARGQKTGVLIRQLVEAELGIFFFNEQGVATFWNRYHWNTNPGGVMALSYSNMTDLAFIDTPVINHVRVTAKPRQVYSNQIVWGLAGYIEIPAGQTLSYVGNFSDSDGDMPVTAIINPTSATAELNTSYFISSTISDGTGTTPAPSLTLSSFTTFGTGFVANFTNTGSVSAFVTAMRIFGQPAKITSTYVQEYKDQTSIDDNGLNPNDGGTVIEITNDYIQDAGNAYAYAYVMVTNYAQPRRQFATPVFANPALQFGDVVTVAIADTGENLRAVVFGDTLSMDADAAIKQTLTIEARNFTSYFRIGVSSIAGTDQIAP